jgi:flagellar hook assembly protein FlgD
MFIDYVRLSSPAGINEGEITSLDMIIQTSLNAPKPNPVINGIANISFTIASPSNAALKIYDASGRLIKTLVDRNFEKGVYNYNWNSNDENNRQIAEGIYFCALETPKQKFTKKLILTR